MFCTFISFNHARRQIAISQDAVRLVVQQVHKK